MIIQGVTINGVTVYDSSFNSNGALLYLDAGQSSSYSGSGLTWTDLSTNTNNATLNGPPTFTSAGSASYFTFNGAGNQYAYTPTAKWNKIYTGKTVLVAARLTAITTGTYRCLFGTASGTRNFNTYIYRPSAGTYQIHYSVNGVGVLSDNLSLTTNQWFVLTVTHSTGGLVSYYLNGQPVGTNTGVTFSQWVSNGNENIGVADNFWYGDISVCAVYGRQLSSDEIKQNFNSLRTRYGL
jgi:hypothetical protein